MTELFHPLKIKDIRHETEDSISIAFDLTGEAREHFKFTPGQYVTLRTEIAGEEQRRSYSICSALDDDELRVAIRRVPGGTFSCFAHDHFKAGGVLDVMRPGGRFGMAAGEAEDAERHYLAFAAGSGITPIISITKSVLRREPRSRFTLVYGNRTSATIMFKDALEDLKDRFVERLSVHHVLSREKQDVPLLDGRIDAAKAQAVLSLCGGTSQLSAAFLCGPYDMMETVHQALVAAGVAPEKIRREVFSTAGMPVTGGARLKAPVHESSDPDVKLSVKLDGITHHLSLAKGETVLSAALRRGLDLPYSCRAGMCCTCRARLVEGEVEMIQNFSLEPWEMAAGFVLTCQSVPKTAAVSVDFDAV